jgi:hypothetical protein
MKRRHLAAGVLAMLAAQACIAIPALAATFVEQVVFQLRAQGFEEIEIETTLLGRTRIAADRLDGSREIVLNPTTGEILRDLWTSKSGQPAGTITIGVDGSPSSAAGGASTDDGGNSGSGGGDDNDNGSGGGEEGGGNSGSGGGGGGSDDGDDD